MPIRKSSTSGTPFGNISTRPSNPTVGQSYYNGELGYLEIYTSSEWIPIGSGSFNVLTSSGGIKTATLSTAYPAGTYMIESKANDSNLVVYLASAAGILVGASTAGSRTVTASDSFIYVSTENADSEDLVTFTYKPTATLQTKTDAVWAKPTITAISVSGLPNQNDTTVISGTNFASNVGVQFRKSDNTTLVNAKSVVRTSATSLTVTRPDTFSPSDAPYDLVITNPDTGYSVTSVDAITAGSSPVWSTAAALGTYSTNANLSITLSATDSDGGSSVIYSLVSGSLPSGISLNSSSGLLSGTLPGSSANYDFTIRATDSGGNNADRAFNLILTSFITSGGTITSSGSERIHTFTANGTFTIPQTLSNVKVLLVAGGGGSCNGGGGGGGLLYHAAKTLSAGSYSIVIGGGGTSGNNGTNSTFSDMTAIGGGGGCCGTGGCNGNAGGSGGGGGRDSGSGGAAQQGNSGGATGYGNNGGSSANSGWGGAGGGGGAGSAGSQGSGGSPNSEYGGAGGNGRQYDITGTATYYAGGGNGGWGAGGTNGGQAGLGSTTNAPAPANSGSGAAGAASGICVIRFTLPA